MANNSSKVRVRLAPSPTGYIHIGTMRTALFDFLFAGHNDGTVILRIEDTDQNRFVEGALENMLKVFRQMGLEFDEGYYLDAEDHIQEKGDYGPYIQSKRLNLYHEHAKQLIGKGAAYYCFCDESRLEDLRKEQIALKKPPMYDRHCRNLSPADTQKKLKEFEDGGKKPVVRQAIPLEGQTVIHDLVFGDITYDHRVLDDQVLLKSDGFPTYHLAVIVDDHLMEISHVIRGEEWIPSTPKHILLYQAFGWEPTAFAHLPLILNPDKSKLSKRQGDVSVEDFLNKGYLPEALLNFVAFLGWNPKTEQEIFTLQEMIDQFDFSKVNKAGAVLDMNKLDWMNGLYIRTLDPSDLAESLIPYWEAAGLIDKSKTDMSYLTAVANLEKERLKKLSEIGERTRYFFVEPEVDPQLLVWKKSSASDAKEKLTALAAFLKELDDSVIADSKELEARVKAYIQENSFDTGSVLWPMRVALTGLPASPTPFEVASTLAVGLGKEAVIRRLEKAATSL